jgi:hypothetical protein
LKLQYTSEFGNLPFFFNIGGAVGKGYPHAARADVAFVQFCFAVSSSTPELAPSWSKVRVTGSYDDYTQVAINALQAERRRRFGRTFETDGIISVVPPGKVDYSGQTPYMLVFLNYVLMMSTPSIWPRLDKHKLCTASLGEALRQAISSDLTA